MTKTMTLTMMMKAMTKMAKTMVRQQQLAVVAGGGKGGQQTQRRQGLKGLWVLLVVGEGQGRQAGSC